MAINKKLIHFEKGASFDKELENGNILDTSICFIKDRQQIYTHGLLYNCDDPGFEIYSKNIDVSSNLVIPKENNVIIQKGNTHLKNTLLSSREEYHPTNSVSEGNSAAVGAYSHAEGRFSEAIGTASHAEGNSTAIGINSHSEGLDNFAEGANSHVEGEGNKSIGVNSHAEGLNNQAIGNNSHAEGYNNITYNSYEHASGASNISKSDQTLFTIGNGFHLTGSEGFSDSLGFSTISIINNLTVTLNLYFANSDYVLYSGKISTNINYDLSKILLFDISLGDINVSYDKYEIPNENGSYYIAETNENININIGAFGESFLLEEVCILKINQNKEINIYYKRLQSLGNSSSIDLLFNVIGYIEGGQEYRHNAFEVHNSGDIYIPDTLAEGEYYEKPMIHLQKALKNISNNSSNSNIFSDGIVVAQDVDIKLEISDDTIITEISEENWKSFADSINNTILENDEIRQKCIKGIPICLGGTIVAFSLYNSSYLKFQGLTYLRKPSSISKPYYNNLVSFEFMTDNVESVYVHGTGKIIQDFSKEIDWMNVKNKPFYTGGVYSSRGVKGDVTNPVKLSKQIIDENGNYHDAWRFIINTNKLVGFDLLGGNPLNIRLLDNNGNVVFEKVTDFDAYSDNISNIDFSVDYNEKYIPISTSQEQILIVDHIGYNVKGDSGMSLTVTVYTDINPTNLRIVLRPYVSSYIKKIPKKYLPDIEVDLSEIESKLEGVTKAANDSEVIKRLNLGNGNYVYPNSNDVNIICSSGIVVNSLLAGKALQIKADTNYLATKEEITKSFIIPIIEIAPPEVHSLLIIPEIMYRIDLTDEQLSDLRNSIINNLGNTNIIIKMNSWSGDMHIQSFVSYFNSEIEDASITLIAENSDIKININLDTSVSNSSVAVEYKDSEPNAISTDTINSWFD